MKKQPTLYFIEEHLGEEYFHGGVGNSDMEKIFLERGITPIKFPFRYDLGPRAKLARLFYLLKLLRTLPAGAVIFFQDPLYATMHKMLLRALLLAQRVQLVCIVADINGLKYGDPATLKKDIKRLERFRYFILHNEAMQNWFNSVIPNRHIALLSFFDFLAPVCSVHRRPSSHLAFTGNLVKSKFLEKTDTLLRPATNLTLHVYGPGISAAMEQQSSIKYEGVVQPASLPATVKGSFGLLWDGDGTMSQQDSFGHYMQYISHHKLSLYILSGLPVVAFANAGTASLIAKYGIGILVEKLSDIGRLVSEISPSAYEHMRERQLPLAEKISTGKCVSEAIEEILRIIHQVETAPDA